MNKFRNHIIYGILPNSFIFFALSLYIFCMKDLINYLDYRICTVIFATVLVLSIALLRSKAKPMILFYYLGYKYLERPYRLLITTLYFLIILLLAQLFIPSFFEVFPIEFIVIVLLAEILFIEFLLFKYNLTIVTFIRITPRLYIDVMHLEVHTKEQIETYDIIPKYIEDLSLSKLDLFKQLFYDPDFHQNYLKDKIEKIDFEISDDDKQIYLKAYDKEGRLIWNEIYVNDLEDSGNDLDKEVLIQLFVSMIIDIENA